MTQSRRVDDFVKRFKNLSEDEKKEFIKQVVPEFCQIAMGDEKFFKEMMPKCMDMMSGMRFPMQEMMSKMMGKA